MQNLRMRRQILYDLKVDFPPRSTLESGDLPHSSVAGSVLRGKNVLCTYAYLKFPGFFQKKAGALLACVHMKALLQAVAGKRAFFRFD